MSNAPVPSSMMTRGYKSGSVIFFEGDKSEYIYILKSGKVILTSIKLDSGEEVKEEVKPGEFFGVKSSLGRYPREETAQTVGETVVLVLALADFEKLILRNVNVVRKMLRVFSNQLRRIGKMVRSVLGDTENINPEVELYKIGEFYYKAGIFNQARYAFKRYLEYYPDAQYAQASMQRIKAIDSGQAVASDISYQSAPQPVYSEPDSIPRKPEKNDDFGDFSIGDDFGGKSDHNDMMDFDDSPSMSVKSNLTDEMDSFMSDDKGSSLDDFSSDFSFGDDHASSSSAASIKSIFEQAQSMAGQGRNQDAIEKYQDIMSSIDAETDEDKRYLEMSYFETGRLFNKMGKARESVDAFNTALRIYPESKYAKETYLTIGMILESAKQKEKAAAYYKKVLSIKPDDRISQQAAAKLKGL